MPLELIVEIAEAVKFAILGGAIAGAIGEYCKHHKNVAGCIKSRSIIDTENVPRMRIGRGAAAGPCGVPQQHFDDCHAQLAGTHVKSSIPSPGVAQFDGVPQACMDLASSLTGACGDKGPAVNTCGSACLHYSNLSDEQFAALSNALTGKK